MRRRHLFAADLEPLQYPVPVRRDLGQAHRGPHGDGQPAGISRMALSIDDTALTDAANPDGFAAAVLTAAIADLYPNGVNQ